jgi:tRNA (mo5U34)-methyltransferase
MKTIDMQEEIDRQFWWHSIRLPDGRVTPGKKSLALMDEEASMLFDSIELKGKSLLDVGAWNGGFSIEAKRRGASRVVALDYNAWVNPALQGRRTFDLAIKLCNVEIGAVERDLSVPALDLSDLGEFDIVLFSGVFYHLVDPIATLRELSRITKETIIVETHIDRSPECRPMMVFYPGKELANDPSNWWGPNPVLIEKLLEHFGFFHTNCQQGTDLNRAVFHGFKASAGAYSAMRVQNTRGLSPPIGAPMVGGTPEEVVAMIYRVVHARTPDPTGFAAHVAALKNGKTLEDVLKAALDSKEYRERVYGAVRAGTWITWPLARAIPDAEYYTPLFSPWGGFGEFAQFIVWLKARRPSDATAAISSTNSPSKLCI